VDPATVHTVVVLEVKTSARPEDAVAMSANGAIPSTLFTGA